MMQIVYISIRPEVLAQTVAAVARFMPFVTRALVLTPSRLADAFTTEAGLETTVLTDEQCLGKDLECFQKSDHHQEKSFLLRYALANSDAVDDVFIMSDDDYRPLRPLRFEFFHERGVDHGYYFHDTANWSSRVTDYDKGLIWTAAYLQSVGQPTLAYSSHMPQIIRKRLFREALEHVRQSVGHDVVPADEWSVYFNHVGFRYPEKFDVHRKYETLNWPPLPTDWNRQVSPDRYTFENYYPEFYLPGQMFEELSDKGSGDDWREIYDAKVSRRRTMEARSESLEKNPFFSTALAAYRLIGERFPSLFRRIRKPVKGIAQKIFRVR